MNRANAILWTVLAVIFAYGCAAPVPGGTIIGAIHAKDSAANVHVEARPLEDPKGKGLQTVTDDTGRYRFETVPPGRYEILAGPVANRSY